MRRVTFATGNTEKFTIAQTVLRREGIDAVQAAVELDEIQAEDNDKIVTTKAKEAFKILRQPLVVSDDSWAIPGLQGFPGPYMKSINHWFTPEDFIRLTSHLQDRRIILTQHLAYKDQDTLQLFALHHTGLLLDEPRGNYGDSAYKVITMPGDKGKSLAEVFDKGGIRDNREAGKVWLKFSRWYKEHIQ